MKKTSSIDSLFGGVSIPETRHQDPLPQNTPANRLEIVPHNLIDPHPDHPCKLYGGAKAQELLDSIKSYGVLEPVTLMPKTDGRYTLLAGYNRLNSNKLAGNDSIPAIIRSDLTQTQAILVMLHSNCQRGLDQMRISERARMMVLEYETLKKLRREQRQSGTDSTELVVDGKVLTFQHLEKTREAVAQFYGIKASELQYYIRLESLDEGLLEQVDEGVIQLYVAALLSHLDEEWQKKVWEEIVYNGQKINKETAKALKKEYEKGTLTERSFNILLHRVVSAPAPRRSMKLSSKILHKYFVNKSSQEIMNTIEKALDQFFKSQSM